LDFLSTKECVVLVDQLSKLGDLSIQIGIIFLVTVFSNIQSTVFAVKLSDFTDLFVEVFL
jgi:hypothetical protein